MVTKDLVRFSSLVVLFCLLVSPLQAKRFTSQYCEFELPPGWECALEGTEWVCQSTNKDRKKEAIIILAAKIRGSQDSLPQYQAYLKKAKTFTLPGGKTQVSEGKYTKVSKIHGQAWVDSLHMASEVPGFYTRYMATVKEDLGIAVTFSVAKDHYDSYQDLFEKIIQTLKVFRQKKTSTGDFKLAGDKRGDLLDTPLIPSTDTRYGIGVQKKSGGDSGSGPMEDYLIYIAIGGAVAFGLAKLRKKKGSGSSKKKKKKSKSKTKK